MLGRGSHLMSRRRGLALAAWVVLAAAAPSPAAAQSRVTTILDTTLITVGDRLTFEVRVEHPVDAAVSWPDSVVVEPFEVLQARVAPTRSQGESAVSVAVFSLTTFELGEVELPSFPIRVLHPDGQEEELATDRYGVEVVSVGVEDGSDIREIRGPLAIPVGIVSLLVVALLLMLFGAAAYAAWARRRKKDGVEGFIPGPPPRPAHEIALEEFQRLEDSMLLANGQVKEYHIRVSEILRRYVEARFNVPALEMTTWEVLGGLQSVGVVEDLRADLRRFLDQCDLVKFAKAKPDEPSSQAVLELGRELVRRSTTAEEGEAPEPAAESATEPAPESSPEPAPESAPEPAHDPAASGPGSTEGIA